MTDLLLHLGHQEVFTRKGGREYWYRSPFRRERTPSFKVNTGLNCWADFGIGGLYHKPDKIGGNIIDFAKHEKQTSSTSEALRYLRELKISVGRRQALGDVVASRQTTDLRPCRREQGNPMELVAVKPLGSKLLLNYVASRKIDLDIARHYLKECHYRIKGKGWGGHQRPFFAVGMQNDSMGYEIRSEYFKGLLGKKKDTTTLRHTDDPYLNVFEGMMDFLSLLTVRKGKVLEGTTMVLHSTNMVGKAVWFAEQYGCKKVVTWLDNDAAGEQAYARLEGELPAYGLIRGNGLYKGFGDLNDWLVDVGNDNALHR